MNSLLGTYDYRLVALSLTIAIVTSYTTLGLAERVRANQGGARRAWLVGGASVMGSGIWCMHYTGMLAFQLPIPVFYHLPTVALSLFVAILASLVALHIVSASTMTTLSVLTGSLLMGSGIATMHYVGMTSMRLQAMHHYHLHLLVLSIVLAVLISLIGLRLIFHYQSTAQRLRLKMAVAVVLGIAIATTHYTGMAAVSFTSMPSLLDLSNSVDMTTLGVFAIIIATILLLGFAVLATLIDRQLSVQRTTLDDERIMLRALIDNIPDYMYVKDLNGRFLIANSYLAREVGTQTPEQILGKTDYDFYPSELANGFHLDEMKVIQSGEALYNREEKGRNREGHEIDVLTTKVPLRDQSGRIFGIAGVGRDITALKTMEHALREAETKYRGIFDKAIFGIFQSTPDGALLTVNQAMAFTFAYDSPAEMVASITDIGSQLFVSPQRGIEFMLVMDKAGGVRNFECEMFCKDSKKIWINLSIRAIRDKGAVVRYEGMCDDITERNQLREQLFQSQKLESVGQLAAGIAHEINTPIQYVGDNVRFLQDGFADLIKVLNAYDELVADGELVQVSSEKIGDLESLKENADIPYLVQEVPKAIRQALEGVSRVGTLVKAMREFSHPGSQEKIPIDVNHAIDNTITVARNEWKYVAEVVTDFDPSLPPVSCLPGELNQVILNLIVNAAHSIGDVVKNGKTDKGKITVSTRGLSHRAEIRIEDTGTGIPDSVRGRIFDPFFTTKEIGKGTGQGLSIARSVIVNHHGGTIQFETNEGIGTTFIIQLPYDGKPLKAEGVTP